MNVIRSDRSAHALEAQLASLAAAGDDASDIINPYVRQRGSTYYIPSSGIEAITVRGTPDELAKSRDLIREFEKDPSAACRLPMTIIKGLQDQMSGAQGPAGTGPVTTPPKKR